jgi:hypothetical protein
MFLPIQCRSVNNRSMLAGLSLVGTCSHYRSLDNSFDLQLYEYDDATLKTTIALDLVICSNSGGVSAHDFLLLKDGNWRDSFGNVSGSIEALLPSLVLTAQLVKREDIQEFLVEG